MKRLLTIFFITAVVSLICSITFAADNINFRDAVVTAKLIKVQTNMEPEAFELKLDLPFPIYSEKVMLDGRDITYSYRNDLSLEGREVLVLVHYRIKGNDDTSKVRAYSGLVGETWAQVKAAPVYTKNFKETKAEALATSVSEGVIEKYKGADAAEPVPMYPGMCGTSLKVEAGKELTEEKLE